MGTSLYNWIASPFRSSPPAEEEAAEQQEEGAAQEDDAAKLPAADEVRLFMFPRSSCLRSYESDRARGRQEKVAFLTPRLIEN